YQSSRTLRRVRIPQGAVKRMSVAVVIDHAVRWEGQGELEIQAGRIPSLAEAGRIIERSPGRLVFEIDPKRDGPGIVLKIVRIDERDPIRNIRVFVPGGVCEGESDRYCDDREPCDGKRCIPFEEAGQRFHPRFLKMMRDYALIRFMNWADENATHTREFLPPKRHFETSWESRVKLEDAQWFGRVPVEVMIELANAVHAEPWLTIPSRADDHYVRMLGALVRSKLDPSLRVWIEYSNEVWNAIFHSTNMRSNREKPLASRAQKKKSSVASMPGGPERSIACSLKALVMILSAPSGWSECSQARP
ncbi:MAG: hypothetical protein N2515_04420, partial [Deltaproteobacteria bacterium]|nr:hypothetical protein [Deltaproteobacteria bacterium]